MMDLTYFCFSAMGCQSRHPSRVLRVCEATSNHSARAQLAVGKTLLYSIRRWFFGPNAASDHTRGERAVMRPP